MKEKESKSEMSEKNIARNLADNVIHITTLC